MHKPTSDFNLLSLNTQQLYQHLRATIEYGGNAFVVGTRGSGKTSINHQAIRDSKFKAVEWDLQTFERPDLGGYPRLFSLKDENYIQYLLPHFFRPLLEGNEKIVLVLDEVDKADFSILHPLLDILQFRSINGRPLVNLQAILMTGNLPAEGGKRPQPTLLDRSEKYLVQADFQHWSIWAANEGQIHPAILGYLYDNKSALIGEPDQGQNYADKSPRGWDNASKITKFGEKYQWSPDLITEKVAGCVGKEAGIQYQSYYTHYQVLLPLAEKIGNGEKIKEYAKLHPGQQLIITMILCKRLGEEVKNSKKPFSPFVKQVGKFLQSSVDEEMAVLALRAGVGVNGVFALEGEPIFDKLIDKLVARSGLTI